MEGRGREEQKEEEGVGGGKDSQQLYCPYRMFSD